MAFIKNIKSEPLDFLEENFLHVLQLKPDSDVFFTHFYDSPTMEMIRYNFTSSLFAVQKFYCMVLQFLRQRNGQNSMRRVVIFSIGSYRSWFEFVLAQLPANFEIPHFAPFDETAISLHDVRVQLKNSLALVLLLSRSVKSFDRKWSRDVNLASKAMKYTLHNIIRDLEKFDTQNQPAFSLQRISRHYKINCDFDTVTHAINVSFPAAIFESLFQ